MLLDHLDHIYVINLPSRTDRRREVEAELTRLGLSFAMDRVTCFPAIRPTEPGPFPSIGARGCFLSHLEVLRLARDRKHEAFLLLEDDATFDRDFRDKAADLFAELGRSPWDIAYLGGYSTDARTPSQVDAEGLLWSDLPHEVGIMTTHAMLFSGRITDLLISFLEAMLARPAGSPEGGPMHVDGAYSSFRREKPEVVTRTSLYAWARQRSSRSDVSPASWKERVPGIGLLRITRNFLRKSRVQ